MDRTQAIIAAIFAITLISSIVSLFILPQKIMAFFTAGDLARPDIDSWAGMAMMPGGLIVLLLISLMRPEAGRGDAQGQKMQGGFDLFCIMCALLVAVGNAIIILVNLKLLAQVQLAFAPPLALFLYYGGHALGIMQFAENGWKSSLLGTGWNRISWLAADGMKFAACAFLVGALYTDTMQLLFVIPGAVAILAFMYFAIMHSGQFEHRKKEQRLDYKF